MMNNNIKMKVTKEDLEEISKYLPSVKGWIKYNVTYIFIEDLDFITWSNNVESFNKSNYQEIDVKMFIKNKCKVDEILIKETNKTEIEYKISVMLHFKEGGEVEFCSKDDPSNWIYIQQPHWNWELYNYRERKNFNYPMYFMSLMYEHVVRFDGLRTGEIVKVSASNPQKVGYKCNSWVPHTDINTWKRVEEPKIYQNLKIVKFVNQKGRVFEYTKEKFLKSNFKDCTIIDEYEIKPK